MLSADNHCKQFGSRSGWSWSKPFYTLIVFLNFFLKKVYFGKKSEDDNKSIKNYLACKEFRNQIRLDMSCESHASRQFTWRLALNSPIATKVVCYSCLLKCLRSLYSKQCGPRSDCSYLFWVHAVCFYT